MRTQFNYLALFYSMALTAACASQPPRSLGVAPSGALGVITSDEIQGSHGATAYEVVERMHPMYLDSKIDLGPTEEREVYLNGVRLGVVDQLRRIPAQEVKEIRFVRAIDAGVYGVGRSGGTILVISKA